jgi:hypothetical protein
MNAESAKALDRFFRQFAPTEQLARQLTDAQSHAQEIVILLCSRIDALASGAAREGEPSAKAFARFVETYGGNRRLLASVSLGDVYYELDYHLWLSPGIIEKAGRIKTFSRVNDPILRLLVDSEIPITLKDAQRLLSQLLAALRKNFRVTPSQRKKGAALSSPMSVTDAIVRELKRKRAAPGEDQVVKCLTPLLSSKIISRILYERFRCEAIHGGYVVLDGTKFFHETNPYWKPLETEHYGPFQLIEFPAKFLMALFSNCMRNYRKHLETLGKVPPGVHFQMFPDDPLEHTELLDESFLPAPRIAVPR